MNVLFIGDSITRGRLGAGFVTLFQQAHPGFAITNLGKDGDILQGILKRLIAHLEANPDYDVIVVEGGYNDILLPSFQERGPLFRYAFHHQHKKGLRPAKNELEFYRILKQSLCRIKQLYRGRLILVTLGCINEKLVTALNRQRKLYNQIIRDVAAEEKTLLADVEARFEAVLEAAPQTDYCLKSFWAVTFTDPLISLFDNGPSWLSRKRNLNVTIDGVHLNQSGAKLFNDCIGQVMGMDFITLGMVKHGFSLGSR